MNARAIHPQLSLLYLSLCHLSKSWHSERCEESAVSPFVSLFLCELCALGGESFPFFPQLTWQHRPPNISASCLNSSASASSASRIPSQPTHSNTPASPASRRFAAFPTSPIPTNSTSLSSAFHSTAARPIGPVRASARATFASSPRSSVPGIQC